MNLDKALKPAFAALAFGAIVLASPSPAVAKLNDPGQGGVISGGFFRGLPLGPKSSAVVADRVEATEIVGETCYLVPSRVANERGNTSVRLVRMCE